MIRNKKNKTFRARNYINYTDRGKMYLPIKLSSVLVDRGYASLEDKSMVGLYSCKTGLVYDTELGSLDKVLKRLTKKIGTYHLFVRAYNAYTSKPSEVRMGKGKGKEEGYLARLMYGQCLCMVSGMPHHIAYEILKAASLKLSFKTVIHPYIVK